MVMFVFSCVFGVSVEWFSYEVGVMLDNICVMVDGKIYIICILFIMVVILGIVILIFIDCYLVVMMVKLLECICQ